MDFKNPQIENPIDANQIAKLIESIHDLARRIPDAATITFKNVKNGEYRVQIEDQMLLTDARGGTIRIVLPLPNSNQRLEIKNKYTTSNAVTIVRIDGKPLGNGNASYVVSDKASGPSARLFCDASQWWVL